MPPLETQGPCDLPATRHLVCPCQHRLLDGQAERLRGLEVDDQLERPGPLDVNISGFVPLRSLSTYVAATRLSWSRAIKGVFGGRGALASDASRRSTEASPLSIGGGPRMVCRHTVRPGIRPVASRRTNPTSTQSMH